jgi:pimeloyl-ACP methyl ester carboxylesterase
MTTTASMGRRLEVGSASVAYFDSGGDGPPVMLLHGLLT